LRKGILPRHSQHAFIRAVKRDPKLLRLEAAKFLLGIASLDGQASFTQENCSALIVRLLSDVDGKYVELVNLAFGADALRDRVLKNVNFKSCFFSPTSLETSQFQNCRFTNCTFGQLIVYDSTKFVSVIFSDCVVDSLQIVERQVEIWDPNGIRSQLHSLGVDFGAEQTLIDDIIEETSHETDLELRGIDKLLRYFMRSTHISESVIRMKLGKNAQAFIDTALPELISCGVLVVIENRGGDFQRRFKLGTQLQDVNRAMTNAAGSYKQFLANFPCLHQ
jgi:hypothetical protein